MVEARTTVESLFLILLRRSNVDRHHASITYILGWWGQCKEGGVSKKFCTYSLVLAKLLMV